MVKATDVWVIVPAFNEAKVISAVLGSLTATGHSVVVVDDCSTDATREWVAQFDVHLLSHCLNLGQGAAIQTGIDYALSHGAKFIVTFDADGQHQVEDVSRLVQALDDGRYEVALGSRFLARESAADMPWAKRLLLRAARRYTQLFMGISVSDTHNGLKAFSANAASKLELTQNRYAHADQMLAQIRAHRLRHVEVSVTVLYTAYSIQKGQKMSNAFNIVWDTFMERLHL